MSNTENTYFDGTVVNGGNDEMSKNEKKLARIKIGLIVAVVAQVAWVLALIFNSNSNTAVSDFFCYVALPTTLAAYIIGGGLGFAFKTAWGAAKKLFFFGWLVVPFPIDIFSGLFTSMLAFIFLPAVILCLPLLLVFLNYRRVQKEFEE